MFKSIATAVLAVSFAGAAIAEEGLTTSEFLKWNTGSQKSFITTVTIMGGLIAAKNRTEQAKCIDSWYATNQANGFPTVISAMKRFPNYHPVATISAVIQKECGDFKYTTTAAALP
jgi:hypothetical protein